MKVKVVLRMSVDEEKDGDSTRKLMLLTPD